MGGRFVRVKTRKALMFSIQRRWFIERKGQMLGQTGHLP